MTYYVLNCFLGLSEYIKEDKAYRNVQNGVLKPPVAMAKEL